MYQPSSTRYHNPSFYRRCGKSGLKLPLVSLGLWHNFGGAESFENSRALARRAFDLGITHFDLANNYGPPYGSVEETFGRLFKLDLAPYRDELIVSTKAAYDMWPGPYGDWGSRKYLLSSLDQSLRRLNLDYVDVFYHHRPDPETPLEETAGALAQAVRNGKALYVGVSNYPPEQMTRMTPDRTALAGDGWDAMPVTVEALDAQGRPVPTANLPVEFEITGAGANIGTGNGDPNSHEPEKTERRSLFNGLAQVIVQSRHGGAGEIVLRAKSAGLQDAETKIAVNAVAPIPSVAKAQPMFNLQKWRMSVVTTNAPDRNQEIVDNDQNSWEQVQSGKLQTFAGGSYAIYRIKFKPVAGVQKSGGQIVFTSVTGKAQVWFDKKLIGKKEAFDTAPFTVMILPGEGERTLSVLIEAQADKSAGFGGVIRVENIK